MSSSSSCGKCTLALRLCFCEVEPILRYSKTKANPGRPFLGCPNYNTKGSLYCKYFKWEDSNEYIQLQEYANELSRIEEQLEKRLFDVEIQVIELRKIVDEIKKREMMLYSRNEEVQKKELLLIEREAVLRCSRLLSRVYFGLFVVVCYYLMTR